MFKRNKDSNLYNVENMLFRNSDGFIIEIKKSDFKNDYVYYSTLMKIKTQSIQQPVSKNKIKTNFITKETVTEMESSP